MVPFNVINASSIEEAVAVLKQNPSGTKILAGGTDIVGGLKRKIYPAPPRLLLNVSTIDGMRYIREDDGMLKIGARTTLDEIANNDLVKCKYIGLAEAAEKTASPLLRYTGTVAGNICQDPRCWYFRSDGNYFNCLMKGGDICYAMGGDHRYHSVMGSVSAFKPACSRGCPTSVEIADYMAHLRADRMDEAAEILMASNPIPAITGRICPHFCQESCGRNEMDDAVSIRAAERSLGDYILENSERFMRAPANETGKRIAVVGSGPAGLSAAYYLRKAGFQVSVLEKLDQPGGMLAYGIPNYRLPNTIVERQIAALAGMGIEFVTGVEIGRHEEIEELFGKHDAVIVATGAWLERDMAIDGEGQCTSGLAFLNRVHGGQGDTVNGVVLVVGGGNVAIDVATTAKRLGAEPCVVYRRGRTEMPAIAHEVENAVAEGVQFEFLTQPVEVLRKGDRLAVRCVRMERGAPDASGRASVKPIEGSDFVIEAAAVMKAIGESADFSILPSSLADVAGEKRWHEDGVLLKDNVYAGGDFITGPSTVAQAIRAGRGIATRICRDFQARAAASVSAVKLKEVVEESFETSQMTMGVERSLSEKQADPMGEDIEGILPAQVKKEAGRCMNCGCMTASPSDLAPILMALDAKIRTTERTLTVEEFCRPANGRLHCLQDDEMVTEIVLPHPKGRRQTYQKFRTRGAIDFPIVSAAAVLGLAEGSVTDAKLVFGALAPVPVRAVEVERFLEGREINAKTAEAAAALSVSKIVGLSKNRYKVQIARAMMKQAILACAPPKENE